MKPSTLDPRITAVISGLCLSLTHWSGAQPAGSLSDLDIEFGELKVAFEKVQEENTNLQTALFESQKTLAEIRSNLSSAHGETEIFKRQATELKLRIEALGIDAAGGNAAKLEQRLLSAVSDLRSVNQEKRRLSEALVRLSEAASIYAKAAPAATPEARIALETELRNANLTLGTQSNQVAPANTAAASVGDGLAISVKDDLALVVMNIGNRQGVRVGMPFEVFRGEKYVGDVRIVDVRERISGAVVQNLVSEKDRVQVGDRLRVSARQF